MAAEIDRRFERRLAITHRFIVTHPNVGDLLNPLCKIECNTKDVSFSGAFVEGDFSAIPDGSTVTIIYERTSTRINSPDKVTQHTFEAILVRKTEDGAGLKFIHQDAETDGVIYSLMKSEK